MNTENMDWLLFLLTPHQDVGVKSWLFLLLSMIGALGLGGPVRADQVEQRYATHGDPTLALLVEQTLSHNTGILRARREAEAGYHRITQATALPDPTLGVTWHAKTPETRTGPQTKSLSINQTIPWPGKRSEQGKVATADADAHREFARAQASSVVRELKYIYYDLAYLDRAMAVNREEEQLLRHYESLARARYAQGLGPQQGAVRLQAEITGVLNRRQGLLRRRSEASATLNSLRDTAIDVPIPSVAFNVLPMAAVDGAFLRAVGRDRHPNIRAARLRMRADRHRVQLARWRYFPDFAVGASWGAVADRRDVVEGIATPIDDGKDVLSLAVGINLPIFRAKNDAALREANARLDSAKAAHRSAVVEVERAVHNAVLRVRTSAEQLRLFQTAHLIQAEQALRLTETAYSTGTAEIIDLLDSEAVLFAVRLELARLRSDYMKALAEVEWAIGAPFPKDQS